MFPGLDLRVGEISESVNKGRHTTVGGYLHPLPGDDGGYVADTPGLREIGMWALAPGVARRLLPRAAPLPPHCRFADCRHVVEPDCAVRAAVEARRRERGAVRELSEAGRGAGREVRS